MWLLLFLLSAGLNIVMGWHYWPDVLAGSLNDPDSYMRLLRIEQGVRAGHLVVTVARDDSGAGVYVEWSRLLDIVLWLMAAPLALFVGWHKALFAAGVALGPLGVGFLGLVLAWAVEPFSARKYLWAAAAAAAILPGFFSIALPGVVHYHILLLAMIALTAGCVARAWRGDRWMGFLAGLSGGFAIWLTPETMPFVLAAYAVLLLRWWQTSNAAVLMTTASGFFDVLGLGFFLDPPGAGYGDPAVDRISYVYVALGLLLLAGAALLARFEKRLARSRGIVGVVLLGSLIVAWIALFPRVIMGPYGVMPAAERQAFLWVIGEQQPVRGADLVVFLFPGLCALFYALWRAVRRQPVDFSALAEPGLLAAPPRQRLLWLYIAAWAAVCLALGAKWLLFAGFSNLMAAALLPIAMSEASSAFAAYPTRAAAARSLCAVLVLLVPLLAVMVHPAASATKPVPGKAERTYPSCSLRHIAPLLAPAAGQIVLSGPEDVPELLYRTNVLTVGSLYIHGVPGYMRDRAGWRAEPGQSVPAAVTATGARWVVFCRRPGRYALVMDLPKDTLWDALEAGTPPPWLQLAGSNADGWQLYKITP
jgi:hypothetical protein